jgi:hypothetical protein
LDIEIPFGSEHSITDIHNPLRLDVAESASGIFAVYNAGAAQDCFSCFLRAKNAHQELPIA